MEGIAFDNFSLPSMDEESSAMKLVSVIIPTYKAVEHLLLCARSLARSDAAHLFEVCIYGDGGGEAARDAISQAEQLLRNAGIDCTTNYNPKNLGNTPAVNRAVALAKGQWLFFCNDDMVFPRDWLMKSAPQLKPMRVLSVTCIEPPVHGHMPSKYFIAANLGLDPNQFDIQKLDDFLTIHAKKEQILPQGVHYPFFVEHSVFEHIGGADERFSGPYHDPDLFLRFRNYNVEMVRTQETALYHFSGVSLRFSDKANHVKKRKKSLRWIEQENHARLSFIKKWGAKPKAKFGEIPQTNATTEFNWSCQSSSKKLQVHALLMWENIRAKLRIFRHSW